MAKTDYDWTAVAADIESGMRKGDVALKYGMSYTTMRNGLKRMGFEGLQRKVIRDRAQTVADDITMLEAGQPAVMYEDGYVDRTETLAEIGANVLVRHRRAFAHTQNIIAKLKVKIDFIIDHEPEIEEHIVMFYGAKAAKEPLKAALFAQQMAAALAAIQIPSLTKSVANIAEAERKLSEAERKAYRLDDDPGDKTYEDYLKEVHEKIEASRVKRMNEALPGTAEVMHEE